MGKKAKKSITIQANNIGVKFMANSINAYQRTKHVDVWMKFVKEFVRDMFLEIKFVLSENNTCDGLINNLKSELFKNMRPVFLF